MACRTAFVVLLASAAGFMPALAGDDAPSSQAARVCTCATFRMRGTGWCESCKKGLIYGCRTRSKRLYDVMRGGPLDKKAIAACPSCTRQAYRDGICKKCRRGYFKGRQYASLYAYALAHGGPLTERQFKCKECIAILREGHGSYCSQCEGGILAGMFFKGHATFDPARKAYEVLETAVDKAPKCEECALAMLMDGTCAHCKITYKAGQAVTQ